MTAIHPNLNFDGKCEAAFDFYKSVFGGDFTSKMKFKEMPSPQLPPTEREKIMHIELPIGKGFILMGSDTPEHMGKLTQGNNFTIAIIPESEKEATRLFNGLSAGGEVTMPLNKTFWNAYFGMFTDKFGIHW